MRRPLAFHEAKVIEEASQGSTRLVSLATADCGGWGMEVEGSRSSEPPQAGGREGGDGLGQVAPEGFIRDLFF